MKVKRTEVGWMMDTDRKLKFELGGGREPVDPLSQGMNRGVFLVTDSGSSVKQKKMAADRTVQ